MNQPTQKPLTSNMPYLLRALYEWLVDNDQTPYICVNASFPGVVVPPHIVKDGKVILNLAMRAVVNFTISNEAILFGCRIGGKHTSITVPCGAVLAIYSQETGQGQLFEPVKVETITQVPINDQVTSTAAPTEVVETPVTKPSVGGTDSGKKRPSHLSVVRND